MTVRVTYYAANQMPAPSAGGLPVGTQSRLVVRDRMDSPIRPSADLTRNALLIPDARDLAKSLAAGPPSLSQPLGELTGLLPRGVTFATRLDDRGNSASLDRRFIAIDVARAAAQPPTTRPTRPQLQLALTIADAGGNEPSLRRETALLSADTPAPGRPLAIAVPFSLSDSAATTIVATIELSRTQTPPAPLLSRLDTDLKRESAAAAATTRPAATLVQAGGDPNTAFVAGVIPGLLDDARRRTSLVSLAAGVDAPLTSDLALSADDQSLTLLTDRLLAQLTAPTTSFDRDSVAYVLDATSLAFLSERQSAHELPKPLEAVLAIHAGEAGRHEGSVDAILQQAPHTRPGLADAIATENLILLTDASPAARVRAYDWLGTRNLAPDGYDPLAPSRQRQTALDRWAEQRAITASSTQPASQPATRSAAAAQR